MSERQEKRKRYNERAEYITKVMKWVESEPPKWKIFKWIKWQNSIPLREGEEK